MDQLVNSLGKNERDLLRDTEETRLTALNEDDLVQLHKRIRKARDKYVDVYRRAGSKKVGKHGGRGKAKQVNSRNAERAEAFEDALARVSAQLGVVAAEAAAALRAERLAAANPDGTWPSEQRSSTRTRAGRSKVQDRTPKGAGKTKRAASSGAAGARRQAKKDAR